MRLAALTGALLLATPGAAWAEVVQRSDSGFTLVFEQGVSASADEILSAIGQPSAWWSGAHTYSGDAASLRLNLTPGGCWCEDLPGGGVKHGETLLVWPDGRMARFSAPFGPLQGLGADAVLTMSWPDAEDGAQRRLRWSFAVDGDGAGAMADAVDGVLAEQFNRLSAHLERN